MKQKLFTFIITHRVLVVTLLVGLTIFFGVFAAQVKYDNTLETYFFEGDLKEYNQFLDQFGTDEIIAIAFGEEEIFTVENLRLIDSISAELENLPHVRRVLSLTTADTVYGTKEEVSFDPLIDEIPSTDEALTALKEKALTDPFIPGTVLSADARHTAIIAEIDHIIGEFDYKIDLLKQIRALVAKQERKTGKSFYIGGTSVIDDAFFRYNQRDQTIFVPLMVLIIIAIVFVMFRRVGLVALPVVVVLLSVIWTYGFLALLGYKINVISSIIPLLLMGVAIADSMHLIADYLQTTASDSVSKREGIKQAFCHVLTPCFMTSLTTVLGLLSLLIADLAPIRQLGLVAAGGVVFAFIITIGFLPILLSIVPAPKEKYRQRFQGGFLAKLLLFLGNWRKGRATGIIFVSVIGVIPAVLLLTRLNIGTNSLDYFKKGDVVRTQVEWIDANIGGTTSLEFFIDAGEKDALKNPTLLRKMEQFQDYLKGIEGITGAYSVVEMLKSLNRAFHEGDERMFRIPSSSLEVAQQLLIVEGSDDMEELLSDDYMKGRIIARVEMNKSQEVAHSMPEIKHHMRQIFGDAATVNPTGIVYLMNRTEHYLLSSQIKSFLLAFLVISTAMFVMLRSVKLGVFAMIPNLLPILFTMALMPILGISLDVGTVLIAAVALGLVVDDTIHFLSRLKVEIKQTDDFTQAIASAMYHTGRPIIFTSVVLSLGFLVLVFASFSPLVNFGILAFIVILLALVFDLLVLPALMGFAY